MIKLKSVAFHLTYYCENKCPYCYIGNEWKGTHPSFRKVKRVIEREIANLFQPDVTVKNLTEIISIIKKNIKIFLSSPKRVGKNLR